MKKVLTPILLILGLIVVLAGAAWFYEQQWGLDGPFPSQHQHGGGEAAGEDKHDHDHEHEH